MRLSEQDMNHETVTLFCGSGFHLWLIDGQSSQRYPWFSPNSEHTVWLALEMTAMIGPDRENRIPSELIHKYESKNVSVALLPKIKVVHL